MMEKLLKSLIEFDKKIKETPIPCEKCSRFRSSNNECTDCFEFRVSHYSQYLCSYLADLAKAYINENKSQIDIDNNVLIERFFCLLGINFYDLLSLTGGILYMDERIERIYSDKTILRETLTLYQGLIFTIEKERDYIHIGKGKTGMESVRDNIILVLRQWEKMLEHIMNYSDTIGWLLKKQVLVHSLQESIMAIDDNWARILECTGEKDYSYFDF